MNFWLRNIVIGAVLIGLVAALLLNQELLLSLDQELMSESEPAPVKEETVKKNTINTPRNVRSSNAAAEGLSNFYASLQGDIDEGGLKIRNNVVFLPDPKGDLIDLLEARRLVNRPLRKRWQGPKRSLPFRKGETLFQKLSQYAEEDKLAVIWWLNRDYLVKDAFRIEADIVRTSFQIGQAVAGHFDHGLSTYFCYQQRALVLIENEKHLRAFDYLNEECSLLKSKSSNY
ncbi:TcpQ domain-containing protein [Thalassotalea sp. PLHSN55]|uniref:TcpQ domain-containing protein n=1 Tax=Thalassotalea sp. PLHSN55 TaxID=3435888 RepID=UPI003F8628F3